MLTARKSEGIPLQYSVSTIAGMCHGADSDEAKHAKDGRTTKLDVLDVPYRSDQAGWRFRRQRQELDRGLTQTTERGPNLERSGDTAPRHPASTWTVEQTETWTGSPRPPPHSTIRSQTAGMPSDAGDIIAPAVSFLNGDVGLLCQTKSAWCANLKRKRF